jgi:hypothetical protein
MKNFLLKNIVATVVVSVAFPAMAMTADEIMQQVDQLVEPESMKSNMTMVLVDSRGKQRVRQMQNTRVDTGDVNKSLMFFLEPSDIKGTGFLMFDYDAADQDDDQWMFLPSLNKAKRIASGDKTGSFMGSDFSYADMSKRNIEEWTYKILKEDNVNGADVWVIESTPVSEDVIKKTGYVRSIAYIRKDNYRVIRGISYLEKEGEVKLMNVGDHIEIGDYWIGTQTQMLTQKNGKTVHRTLMKVDNIEVDFDVNDSEFTLNRLEQGL